MRRLAVVLLALLLSGCASVPDGMAPSGPSDSEAPADATAADIKTIDDGIAWARSLDKTAVADELSAGINRIGDLVPELDIWFATSNEIGIDLIGLNAEVLGEPEDASTKVDDLNAIVDDIETAIEKGPNP